MSIDNIPVEYRPLSPWAYFGYNILFAIPVIGLICLFVFAFSNANINRRNYARSFFCVYAILIIVCVVFGMAGGFAWFISKM
jgi:VIT1/CCC1 family predicted Fe2+/Mn2+ transporter